MSFSFANPPTQRSGSLITKRLKPEHTLWIPHRYQQRGVDFLASHRSGALFWDPGLGKTAAVLESFQRLRKEGKARSMLVVAPLRVCQLVWRQEGQKWSQFRDLKFALLHGPKKEKLLKLSDVDIFLINPEGINWLTQQFYEKRTLPFDVLCLDELTKFKNHRAIRSKRLRKKTEHTRYRWGLTGSPSPNGYEDLFGQALILDGGKTFGTAKTYFLDQYFVKGFNGFDYELREGSAERIEQKIAPLVLSMLADDYLELPELVPDVITVRMPPTAVQAYEEMKREMFAALPEGIVTAANSGGVYSKLKQLSNGAVYLSESDTKEYAVIHDAKLEALKDLIEELNGRPLLVAYEFQHDLHRLREALGEDTPALAGLSEKKTLALEAAWNRGEVPVLLVHPASAGHGLNLQAAAGSGTAHICWFSLPWDLELYDQTIRRLRRQGSRASVVVNHILRTEGGMDDVVYEALEEKNTSQQKLRAALNAEILRDDPAPIATGSVAQSQGEANMAPKKPKKLGFRGKDDAPAPEKATKRPKGWGSAGVDEDDDLPPLGDEDEEEEEEEPAPRKSTKTRRAARDEEEDDDEPSPKKTPRGWGKQAAADDDEEDDGEQEQRRRIRGKIESPETEEDEDEEPAQRRALRAFPKGVAEQLQDDGEDEEEPEPAPAPKKRGRPKKEKVAEPAAAEANADSTYAYATDRQGGEQRGVAAPAALGAGYGPEQSYFNLNISAQGIPSEALAQIFAALAVRFGAEE